MKWIVAIISLMTRPALAFGLYIGFKVLRSKGFVVTRAKDHRIIYANDAFLDYIGWTIKDLRTNPFTEFISEEFRESTKVVSRALEDGISLFEFYNEFIRPDKSLVGMEWETIFVQGYYVSYVQFVNREVK